MQATAVAQTFEPIIQGRILEDQIADTLRAAIVTGRLNPGERLIETDLAEQFGVSRAPLRAAIRQLVADGLLVNEPRKGTTVVKLSADDIEEIYTLRLALETLAVERLVGRITDEQIGALNAIIAEFSQALKRHSMAEIIQIEMRFHEMLCRMSGHKRLHQTWTRMADQLMTFFAVVEPFFMERAIVANHEELVAAIASGARERAVKTIREHITKAVELVGKPTMAAE